MGEREAESDKVNLVQVFTCGEGSTRGPDITWCTSPLHKVANGPV